MGKVAISEILGTPEATGNPNANPSAPAMEATFQKNNSKLDVPVVTLSINNNIKFLEHLKRGFGRAIAWSKYRSEIRQQT